MPFPQRASLIIAAVSLANSPALLASGLDQLKAFLDSTQSMQANFEQTVSHQNGRKPQLASGTVAIQRPGKFHWRYQKPYDQQVVGDGQKLWIYDPDLNQVTVKKLDAALGSSPAALLAGSNDLEKSYRLSELPAKDGLEWVAAAPKSRENTFEAVRLGLADKQLVAMELTDNFGQHTVIRFIKPVKNPKLASDLFTFAPPKGADVVSADQ